MNQIQIFLLLPLTDAYFPSDVIRFLTKLDFTLFSFNFIPFYNLAFVDEALNQVDYAQTDNYYIDMNFTSGSAFVNHFSLF